MLYLACLSSLAAVPHVCLWVCCSSFTGIAEFGKLAFPVLGNLTSPVVFQHLYYIDSKTNYRSLAEIIVEQFTQMSQNLQWIEKGLWEAQLCPDGRRA